MHLKMGHFHNYARQAKPEQARLIKSRHVQDPDKEIYALVYTKKVNLDLFPEFDFFMAELVPLFSRDKNSSAINHDVSVATSIDNYNKFSLFADKGRGLCKFGPTGFPGLEYEVQSYGLGSYLFNLLVEYGQEHYPSFAIHLEHLDLAFANFDRNLMNRFCKRFNFEVIFHGPDDVSVLAKRLDRLTGHFDKERVEIIDMDIPESYYCPAVDRRAIADLVGKELL